MLALHGAAGQDVRDRRSGQARGKMKVVILAGGLGTRLAEETSQRPKPMVEVGGMPILWHIMKITGRGTSTKLRGVSSSFPRM